MKNKIRLECPVRNCVVIKKKMYIPLLINIIKKNKNIPNHLSKANT